MQKLSLLAVSLLALNGLAPKVLAQDDDAELGRAPQESPASSSITEDSEPVENRATSPVPAAQMKAKLRPAAEEPPPPPPPPPASAEPAAPSSSGWSLTEGRRRPGATFGFTISRPESIGKYNHYEYLYGKKRISPGFYGGYYLFSYLLDVGIVGRVAYYHAEGHPLSSLDNVTLPMNGDLSNQTKDKNQKLGLTLIPTQVALEGAISPFKTRWVVLRGWLGKEYLYVQETVEPNLPDSATSSSASTYTSSGWNQGLVTGVMASFTLTGVDSRSDKSLRSLGIDRYYLSLYMENVKTTDDKFGNFDRKTYGIAFSFEGLR